jgi:membrane glycosyltransferase
MEASHVTQIGHVIQLSVAPVFLLTGVGAMLNVLSVRLHRAVDRARVFEARYATAGAAEQDLLRFELNLQARRCRLIYAALALCVVCALMICSVIVALFASAFFETGLGLLIASLFVAAMLAFFAALLAFLREVQLATSNLRIGPPSTP